MKDRDFLKGVLVAIGIVLGILIAFGWVMNKLIMIQM